jgi:hypothetical protein
MRKLIHSLWIVLALLLCSCSENNGWKVEGTVADAADKTIYVEQSTFNNWYVADSIKLSADGKFSYQAEEAAAVPSIFRLRLDGKYIYFPVDSIETITVTANGKNFDRHFTLAGNDAAKTFTTVDSLISASVDSKGVAGAVADADLKRQLNLIINHDTTCLVSYYVIGKFVGTTPLYDLTKKDDVKILANAANNFKRMLPDDARTKELEQRWVAARRALGNLPQREVQATYNGRPRADLKRYDCNGKEHDFDKIVERGGITVLNFTRYDGQNSQANTVQLKSVYDKYKAQGLQIYQIAYDPDEVAWKRSAANMPWIAVWNAPTDNIEALVSYNVDPVNGDPVSFVFNRAGELMERVTDPSKLDAAIAKVL